MGSNAYNFGRTLGQNWVSVLVVAAVLVGTLGYLHRNAEEQRAVRATQAAAERARIKAADEAAEAKRLAELAANCSKDGAFHLKATGEMRQAKPSQAFDTLYPCRNHLGDPVVKALFVTAMSAARKQAEAESAKRLAIEKAAKKKQGVSIGMSQQDVLDSSWGRPERVNTTTTVRGTREQWVYPGRHNYLYFENGVLTSIQN